MAGCNFSEITKDAIWALLDPTLLPYHGLNLLYGVTQSAHLEDEFGLVTSVFFKTAPLWYLVFHMIVIKGRRIRLEVVPEENVLTENQYNKNLTYGLVFSIIGDALLVFPATFFHGVFVFGAAHVFYILAFRKRYGRASYAWAVVPLCMISSPYVMAGLESYSVAAVVVLYNVTLNTMLFYAISSLESQCSAHTLLATVGAFSFVISDTCLAFDMWIREIPYRTLVVMGTYYFAQLNLALSVAG